MAKGIKANVNGRPGSWKVYLRKRDYEKIYSMLWLEFDDLVRQDTPTGCTSYYMSAGSTTVHRLFVLHVKSKRTDITSEKVNFDGQV